LSAKTNHIARLMTTIGMTCGSDACLYAWLLPGKRK
jgi:hypothetical protein